MVIAVPLATHTGGHPEICEPLLIGERAILGALVGMMNQADPYAPLTHGHCERIQRELLIGLRTHLPANDASGVEVQEHGHIEPPRTGRHRGDIPDPDPLESEWFGNTAVRHWAAAMGDARR